MRGRTPKYRAHRPHRAHVTFAISIDSVLEGVITTAKGTVRVRRGPSECHEHIVAAEIHR
jgi:hypothetical protein